MSAHVQLRLSPEEAHRYAEVIRRARGRDPGVMHSHVNRILIGLSAPDSIVTEEEVLYFRGEKNYQRQVTRAKLADDGTLPLQDIRSLERHLRKAQEILVTLKPRAARQD